MNTYPQNENYYVPCWYCGEDVLIDGSVYPAPPKACHPECKKIHEAQVQAMKGKHEYCCVLPDGQIAGKASSRPLAFLVAVQNPTTGEWFASRYTTRHDLAQKYAYSIQNRPGILHNVKICPLCVYDAA